MIIGVQTPSGQTAETLIPLIPERRRSARVPRVKAIAACLLAAYEATPGAAASPASETTLITCPRPLSRIRSIAARVPL